MLHGTTTAPAWLEVLRIAQSMYIQPWKLAGGSKTLWYARHKAVRECEIMRDRRQRNAPAGIDELNARQRKR